MDDLLRNYLETVLSIPRVSGDECEIQDFVQDTCDGERDSAGNIWVMRGGKGNNVLFSAHLDTVYHTGYWLEEDGIYACADSSYDVACCLGADDGAGVALLLYLIDMGIKADYVFTVREEEGAIGAKRISREMFSPYKLAVAFDRKGTKSIITHQLGRRTAKDAVARRIAKVLDMGHRLDTTGIFTDNCYFPATMQRVNISVGYQFAHSPREILDGNYLDTIARHSAMVDWNAICS